MDESEAIKLLEQQKSKYHTEEYKNNIIAQTLAYISKFLGNSSEHYKLIEKLKDKYPNISSTDFDDKSKAIEEAFSAYINSAIETIKNIGIKTNGTKGHLGVPFDFNNSDKNKNMHNAPNINEAIPKEYWLWRFMKNPIVQIVITILVFLFIAYLVYCFGWNKSKI